MQKAEMCILTVKANKQASWFAFDIRIRRTPRRGEEGEQRHKSRTQRQFYYMGHIYIYGLQKEGGRISRPKIVFKHGPMLVLWKALYETVTSSKQDPSKTNKKKSG